MAEYPVRIDNGAGEVLIFERLVEASEGNCVEVRNEVQPGAGPPMHVHFKQEEALTVIDGELGYQLFGEEPQTAGPSGTVRLCARRWP